MFIWVIMAVSIQMLTGPNVWPVSDEGTFASEAECQDSLNELVPRTLSEDMRIAWEEGELKYLCLKVRSVGPPSN